MTPAQNDPPIYKALRAQFYKPDCCTQRDTGRRVEILRESGVLFAYRSNA